MNDPYPPSGSPPPPPPGATPPPPPPPLAYSPPGYGSPMAPMAPSGDGTPAGKDGKLIAAGVLCLISGGVMGIIGLWMFSLTQDDDIGWIDDASGNVITLVAIVLLAIAGAYLAAGVGSVRGRNWGRITAIVISAIFIALTLIGMADGDAAGGIVPLAWCGTTLGLAWAGKPTS